MLERACRRHSLKKKGTISKMEREKAKAVLEAILFTMGESVEIDRLAAVIEEDNKTTKEILDELASDYEAQGRGIGLTTLENAVQLCTKGEFYEYLIKLAKTPKKYTLTDTLLDKVSKSVSVRVYFLGVLAIFIRYS